MIKKGLGKGLDALIGDMPIQSDGVLSLKINDVEPNINQPRKNFNDEKLAQLSESIRQHGIIQPIIVKKDDNSYKIIAGERRWRAARLAGVTQIPAIVKDYSNQEVMEVALIENLQREDLNPIEEAEAYEKLIKEYSLTHEELSGKIGKSRPVITNSMRLLGLSENVKKLLVSGEISAGHARALLALEKKEIQDKIANHIIQFELNVRQTEELIRKESAAKKKRVKSNDYIEMEYLENNLQNILGTKVRIKHANNRGKIMIEYFSNEELDRLVEVMSSFRQNENY